jgi:hypothetical protein
MGEPRSELVDHLRAPALPRVPNHFNPFGREDVMKRLPVVVAGVACLCLCAHAATLVVKEPGMAPRHVDIQTRRASEVLKEAALHHGSLSAGAADPRISPGRHSTPRLTPPNAGDIYWLQTGIDYGAQLTSPLCYGNTRHVCRQAIADIPWCTWETGDSWDNEVLYSFWDDSFWQFTNPDSLSSSGDDAGRISVVTDPLGTVHAVWHQSDDYALDPHEVVYAQRPLWGTWSSPVQLSPEDLKNSVFPVIDIDASGNPWVVWMDRTETPSLLHGMYATYSTDGGLTWDPSTTHRISDADTTVDIPVVAADPVNGDIWVAYEEDEWDPSDIFTDIVVYHYTPGRGWDGGTVVAYSDTTLGEPGSKPNMEPTLVVDGNGVCHVMFQANRYDQNQPGYGTYDANVYLWIGNVCRVDNAAGGAWSEPEVLWPHDRDRLGDRTGNWMGIGVVGADQAGNLYCSCNSYMYVDTTYLYGVQKEAVLGKFTVGDSLWRWKNASRINARGDSTFAKYAQIAQEIPSDGADVIWDEALEGGELPFDVLYARMDQDFFPAGTVANLAATVVPVGGGAGVRLTWQNPFSLDWDGTEVYRDEYEFPELVGLGILMPTWAQSIHFGTGSEYVDSLVVVGQTYYYSAVTWDEAGNFSDAVGCSLTVGQPVVLSGSLVGEDLVLTWTAFLGASGYWVYGAANEAYFEPGTIFPYQHRLTVLPPGTTTWSCSSGIGDPEHNWTYLVMAVGGSMQELCRSNRFGEHDFSSIAGP